MAALLAHENAEPTHLRDTVVAAFDWLQAGFLICSTSGELLFANSAAEQILESKDGLALDEGRRLSTISSDRTSSQAFGDFRSLLSAAAKRDGVTASVTRPSGKLPLTLTVRPTRADEGLAAIGETSALLVVIHDPERLAYAALSGLRELYGLTLTEARLANLMMQGNNTDDCAELLGIRRTTLKMHLRNVYGKMGVQRQSELVSLMYKSFGNIRCSSHALLTLQKPLPVADRDVA